MTSALRRLEIFETASPNADETMFNAHEAETMRQTGFEQGYAAGWSDALEQLRNEDALRRAAVQEAFQAIDFTYSEACDTVEASFLNLLRGITEQVLPQAMRSTVPALLAQELKLALSQQPRAPLVICFAPAARDAMEAIAADFPNVPIELVEEPAFPLERVTLQIGAQSREIDLDHLLGRLRDLIDSHAASARNPSNHKEQLHG